MKKTKVHKTIQHEAEESAGIVGSIDDLLIDILLRLPVKSLIRFKIVSKHWHSLVTNPEFCRTRMCNLDPNPAVGLFLPLRHALGYSLSEYIPFFPKNSTVKPFRNIEFTKDGSNIRILQSCNGLFLCSGFKSRESSIRYYVYNPTTNQYSTLPELPQSSIISGMGLAFDPTKSPHYKLVCFSDLASAFGNYQCKIHIYSSKSGAWRISAPAVVPFAAGQVTFVDGVYWNGAVHWIGYPYEGSCSLYFDIDHEKLEQIPNPPAHTTSDYYFGESCDHLHYVQIPHWEASFNVYEMKRDYSEWFVKYHVDLSLVAAANPGMIRAYCDRADRDYNAFSIFCMVRGEEEANSGKAIRYNLVSKTSEKLHDLQGVEFGGSIHCLGLTKGFQFIEFLC